MRIIDLISFLLPAAVQLVLLVIMVLRRLYRRGMFPGFFAYTLFSIVVTTPRLVLAGHTLSYAILYWSTEVIYGLLALLSLNEVFSRTFFLDYLEHPRLRLIFPTTVVLIGVGLFVWWRFIYATPAGGHFGVLGSAFVAFNEGVHSIEGILLVLFMVLWLFLAPGWNRYDYGILLGFGLSGLVTMTADMVRFKTGRSYETWYEYAPATAYAVVTFIWLHAFWSQQSPRLRSMMGLQVMLEQAKRDNELITTIHKWLMRKRRPRT